MSIQVRRDPSGPMRNRIKIREHSLITDADLAAGGEDAGPDPHDLYDSALGACKALTVLWYAKRKQMPIEDLEVVIERDNSQESKGTYRLKSLLRIDGPLSEAQRAELLAVAARCPVHKLMTAVTTEIETAWL